MGGGGGHSIPSLLFLPSPRAHSSLPPTILSPLPIPPSTPARRRRLRTFWLRRKEEEEWEEEGFLPLTAAGGKRFHYTSTL